MEMRMGVVVLEMVLDGDLTPLVEEGVVKPTIPAYARQTVYGRWT
jgi:hypothetical protein